MIEVCKTTGLKSAIQKVIELLDNDLYDIQEGFIYDYKTEKWYRYKAGSIGLVDESSWSEVLALNLNKLLIS